MSQLEDIAQQQCEMGLEHFVEVVNQLLPQFLPDSTAGSRSQEPINPRLVRYYTTQGLLDKPLKRGREARYTYRHLLQLLVLRRLLADSYSTGSVGDLIGEQPNAVLEGILKGGVQLTVEAANPALAFLSQVRDRERQSRHQPTPPPSAPTAPPAPAAAAQSVPAARSGVAPTPQTWTRLDILDGLELHIRDDFMPPATAHEREHLLRLIADTLAHLPLSSLRRPVK